MVTRRWCIMSIQYQSAQDGASLADQMRDEYIDDAPAGTIDAPVVDQTTGEVIDNA